MEILRIVIITLLIYSAIASLVYIICHENEEILAYFGLGIVGIMIMFVCRTVHAVKRIIRYRIGKRTILYDIDEKCNVACPVKYVNMLRNASICDYRSQKCACHDIFYQKETGGYKTGYRLVERYAPKSRWKNLKQLDTIYKEQLKNMENNCSRCCHFRG